MPPADPDDASEAGDEGDETDGADEATEAGGEAPRDQQIRTDSDADRHSDENEGENGDERGPGLSFSLPPIRFPPFFPADLRLRFPAAGGLRASTSPRRALLAALVFDAADAALALTTGPPVSYLRTVAGTLVAGALVGPGGAVAAWEVAAVAFGAPVTTLFPTLAALVVLRLVLLR